VAPDSPDNTPLADQDPWLTLAEIADELRVSPATVRLWVSQGRLEATRAGARKWLVRRSELDRMLGVERSPSGPGEVPSVSGDPYRPPTPGERLIVHGASPASNGSDG